LVTLTELIGPSAPSLPRLKPVQLKPVENLFENLFVAKTLTTSATEAYRRGQEDPEQKRPSSTGRRNETHFLFCIRCTALHH
jgi:hypothetical protein